MLDSLTVFDKGGLVLYQYLAEHENAETTNLKINWFISQTLLDPTSNTTNNKFTDNKDVFEWNSSTTNRIAICIYPSVVSSNRSGVSTLLSAVLHEYALFEQCGDGDKKSSARLFDATFEVLRKQALTRKDSTENLTNLDRKTTTNKSRGGVGGKEKRVWGEAKITKEAMAELDYSKDQTEAGGDLLDDSVLERSSALAEARAAYLPSPQDIPAWQEEEVLEDSSSGDNESSAWGSSLKGLLDQMAGSKVLTAQDLQVPLKEMERMLTSKNVAPDISQSICASVQSQLVNKRLQSFARVKTAVRQGLEAAIAKILQPPKHRQVNVLRAVVTKRDGTLLTRGSPKPYVICMVGINGVGKSTSLAKIAYYLKSNGCRPMIAACDTFRSGAVEQLNVHAKCLDVPLYHKGYAKDPSSVAQAAIVHATEEKNDVVLIDTAGRMQNNVPLMKALSKLLVENQPDLVLFVCEALVGNDGIDQLNMFNKAFRSGGHSRQIDGIVLTKFDTVGDKVGAALTLTHVTGAPIVFCGTGQKYNHLKPLSVQSVIKSLFK
jgi:signal recognition particle receptor subunit alpha